MQIAIGPACDHDKLKYYEIFRVDGFARDLRVVWDHDGETRYINLDKATAIQLDSRGSLIAYESWQRKDEVPTQVVIDWYNNKGL